MQEMPAMRALKLTKLSRRFIRDGNANNSSGMLEDHLALMTTGSNQGEHDFKATSTGMEFRENRIRK
uniref:Uncharacterized protein n=1 Tax=Panagrellus redivivus TaxID=6233 RepID=A0A7E4VX00_PANRE